MKIQETEIKQKLYLTDQKSLGLLYKEYRNQLYALLWNQTNAKDQIEDIIQETFIKLWKSRNKIDPNKPIKHYIFKIACNLAIDMHRGFLNKLKFLEFYKQEKATSFREEDDSDSLKRKINRIMKDIPKDIKLTYSLSRQNDFKHTEIAEILGVSVKTVEYRIGRCLKLIKENLEKGML